MLIFKRTCRWIVMALFGDTLSVRELKDEAARMQKLASAHARLADAAAIKGQAGAEERHTSAWNYYNNHAAILREQATQLQLHQA
ncbi:MAG: hypothetical protein ACRCV9_09115, partial [Burkholderiaceae bacterium]